MIEEYIKAINKFAHSSRPLMFCGHGLKTSGLEKALLRASETINCPVIATSHAKSVYPEDHSLYFGCFGFAASEKSMEFLKAYQPDAILFLGTRLGELSSRGWSKSLKDPAYKIHVDLDRKQLGKIYKVDVEMVADLKWALENILALQLSSLQEEKFQLRKELLQKIYKKLNTEKYHTTAADKNHTPIRPSDFMRVFQELMPENAVVFSDIGNTMAWAIHELTFSQNQEFFLPIGLGTMGSGIGAALGARSYYLDRPIFCLTGDVSALMHCGELHTAIENNLNVKFIVLNDGGHGMVEHGSDLVRFPKGPFRYKNSVNFKSVAEAFHMPAYSARSIQEFLELPLEDIFRSNLPSLIDLKIDPRIQPPILARTSVLSK
ncbi:MAG: thiamine pyrophosphate-binding protein [Bdellovibrionales bacterium]|nr:thiamine pyrophosphate-binding protein [Bdellovibrionales bacterium]